ncbi:MAG: hypothetical protein SFV21_10930 [Rhodospirillaceae bacterium]|nr:hypothetical protein [Rhodospirillaceae bacterium]
MAQQRTTQNSMRQARSHRARGFSIIEMATAIILLGIVFVMTLKGRELVQTGRAFSVGYQMEQYLSRIQLYEAGYANLPGDDPTAPLRFGRPAATYFMNSLIVSEAGDGELDGRLGDTLSANGEHFMAWRDLRFAGLLEGDPELAGASAMPENPFGGVFGFDQGNLGQQPPGSLCATRVPGAAAETIDRRLDDGAIATGEVVATSRFSIQDANHFDAPDTEPYDVEKEYIICLQLSR